ncbi:hypothetical protein PMAYCL1PPCAC_25250, partial [Pristionchus mayeri]
MHVTFLIVTMLFMNNNKVIINIIQFDFLLVLFGEVTIEHCVEHRRIESENLLAHIDLFSFDNQSNVMTGIVRIGEIDTRNTFDSPHLRDPNANFNNKHVIINESL